MKTLTFANLEDLKQSISSQKSNTSNYQVAILAKKDLASIKGGEDIVIGDILGG